MNRLLCHLCAVVLGLTIALPAHGRLPFFLGKSVTDWQKELNHTDAKVRRSAAFALGRMGGDAGAAVPDLVRRLREDKDAGVRDMAASAVGDIAKAAKGGDRNLWSDAGDALIGALKNDGDPHVRRSAAYALGAFGSRAGGAAGTLREALKDENASVRQNAAWALGQIGDGAGEVVGTLCECLHDKDALVRRDAAGALGSVGKAATAGVAPLLTLVKSEPDEVVKKTALDSLSHLAGPEHRAHARGLEPLLKDKDPEVALNAALVLARIGGDEAKEALPALRRALKEADPHMPELATLALANLGPNAEPAMHDLADVLTNPKNATIVRRNAALAIAHVGQAARPVVPSLVQALKTSEPLEVRQFTAEALAQIRYPANERAVPALLEAIEKDTDPLVRQKCVWALFGMNEPDQFKKAGADKALGKLLDEEADDSVLVRYDAARKLANILGADAPDRTVDVLMHMLKNTSLKVYNRTDATVEGGGNEANAGRGNVKANLGGDARYMAVQALGWMGDKAKKRRDVVEALRQAAKDDDKALSKAAVEALERLGIKDKK
jgi:HEAT repeat protein